MTAGNGNLPPIPGGAVLLEKYPPPSGYAKVEAQCGCQTVIVFYVPVEMILSNGTPDPIICHKCGAGWTLAFRVGVEPTLIQPPTTTPGGGDSAND